MTPVRLPAPMPDGEEWARAHKLSLRDVTHDSLEGAYRALSANYYCRERQLREALEETAKLRRDIEVVAPATANVAIGEIEGIVERVLQRHGVVSPRERVDVFAHRHTHECFDLEGNQLCGRAASDGGAA